MRSTIIFMRRPTRYRISEGIHLLTGGDPIKYFDTVNISSLTVLTCYENVDERHEGPPPVEHGEGANTEQGEENVENKQQVRHRVRKGAVMELVAPEIEYYQCMRWSIKG